VVVSIRGAQVKIAVIGDQHTVLGFRLAGAEGKEPGAKPSETLDEFMQRDDLGVLVITSELAKSLRKNIQRWKMEKHFPIIVEIQEFGNDMDEDRIAQLLKRAVGMNITTSQQ